MIKKNWESGSSRKRKDTGYGSDSLRKTRTEGKNDQHQSALLKLLALLKLIFKIVQCVTTLVAYKNFFSGFLETSRIFILFLKFSCKSIIDTLKNSIFTVSG